MTDESRAARLRALRKAAGEGPVALLISNDDAPPLLDAYERLLLVVERGSDQFDRFNLKSYCTPLCDDADCGGCVARHALAAHDALWGSA